MWDFTPQRMISGSSIRGKMKKNVFPLTYGDLSGFSAMQNIQAKCREKFPAEAS